MVASAVAYLMCAVSLVLTASSVITAVEATMGKNNADLLWVTVMVFAFGFIAWGFAYLGGLS